MTLEEYQAELRRISETLAEQNRQFDEVAALLRELPEPVFAVSRADLEMLDEVFAVLPSAPTVPESGLRC